MRGAIAVAMASACGGATAPATRPAIRRDPVVSPTSCDVPLATLSSLVTSAWGEGAEVTLCQPFGVEGRRRWWLEGHVRDDDQALWNAIVEGRTVTWQRRDDAPASGYTQLHATAIDVDGDGRDEVLYERESRIREAVETQLVVVRVGAEPSVQVLPLSLLSNDGDCLGSWKVLPRPKQPPQLEIRRSGHGCQPSELDQRYAWQAGRFERIL